MHQVLFNCEVLEWYDPLLFGRQNDLTIVLPPATGKFKAEIQP
jgi:hypothetical protein